MLREFDEGDEQDGPIQASQERSEMHLRASVADHEIGQAAVIPPPKDEKGLNDDTCEGARAAHLFGLAGGSWKGLRVPIAAPFFQDTKMAQPEIEANKDEGDEQQNGQRNRSDIS